MMSEKNMLSFSAGNCLGKHVVPLFDSLRQNTSLEKLELALTELSDDEIRDLQLDALSRLQHIDLQKNQLKAPALVI